MYLVRSGRLQVIQEDTEAVIATLHEGSYFGEISILNLSDTGNRRTANVRSEGYSELLCLSKEDVTKTGNGERGAGNGERKSGNE